MNLFFLSFGRTIGNPLSESGVATIALNLLTNTTLQSLTLGCLFFLSGAGSQLFSINFVAQIAEFKKMVLEHYVMG